MLRAVFSSANDRTPLSTTATSNTAGVGCFFSSVAGHELFLVWLNFQVQALGWLAVHQSFGNGREWSVVVGFLEYSHPVDTTNTQGRQQRYFDSFVFPGLDRLLNQEPTPAIDPDH